MKKKSKFNLFLFLTLFLMATGCVTSSRITDDNLNKIALCTGGLGAEFGLVAKMQAKIDKTKQEGDVNAEINYKEVIKGAIFTHKDLSEESKKYFYDKYIECLFKLIGESKAKLDIPRAYVLDEKYLKENDNNEVYFKLIKHRQGIQYEYSKSDDLAIAIIYEVEGFEANGIKVSLSGDVTIIANDKEIAKAPIPRIHTINEWKKRAAAKGTDPDKIMMFMGYGEQSLGRSIPFLIVIRDFRSDEVVTDEVKIKITVNDELSNEYATNIVRVKFKKI